MGNTFIQRRVRKFKRSFRRLKIKQKVLSFGALAVLLVLLIGMINSKPSIPATAYKPLLDVVANAESRGNYNAYFSNSANQDIVFTQMTIGQVMQWQADFVHQGSPSSAVGRYQIIQPTLKSLVAELKLDPDTKFDQATQDKMAITLMERRGSVDFIDDKLPADEFAHNLSQEWASLPRVIGDAPEASFYAGDGLNKSLVDSKTSLDAVQEFKHIATQTK